ncbi:MAG: hypothetical protein CXT73_06510 [Methanobacteriota archaeon]|nr:MAG: hypothetical protein CXT73_06510 [Euryarchaeota archaeon]
MNYICIKRTKNPPPEVIKLNLNKKINDLRQEGKSYEFIIDTLMKEDGIGVPLPPYKATAGLNVRKFQRRNNRLNDEGKGKFKEWLQNNNHNIPHKIKEVAEFLQKDVENSIPTAFKIFLQRSEKGRELLQENKDLSNKFKSILSSYIPGQEDSKLYKISAPKKVENKEKYLQDLHDELEDFYAGRVVHILATKFGKGHPGEFKELADKYGKNEKTIWKWFESRAKMDNIKEENFFKAFPYVAEKAERYAAEEALLKGEQDDISYVSDKSRADTDRMVVDSRDKVQGSIPLQVGNPLHKRTNFYAPKGFIGGPTARNPTQPPPDFLQRSVMERFEDDKRSKEDIEKIKAHPPQTTSTATHILGRDNRYYSDPNDKEEDEVAQTIEDWVNYKDDKTGGKKKKKTRRKKQKGGRKKTRKRIYFKDLIAPKMIHFKDLL